MGRMHFFYTEKFAENSILLRIEIGFHRSSPLYRLSQAVVPLSGTCAGIEASLLRGRCRTAETPVPGGLLLPHSLDMRTEVVIESVRVRVLRGAARAALPPNRVLTQPGGCERFTASSTTFAGMFPAQRTTPEVCFR